MCATLGVVKKGWIADHIEPHRGDFEKFWRGKLQTLCGPHHDSTKQKHEKSDAIGCDASGLPTNPQHPWS